MILNHLPKDKTMPPAENSTDGMVEIYLSVIVFRLSEIRLHKEAAETEWNSLLPMWKG